MNPSDCHEQTQLELHMPATRTSIEDEATHRVDEFECMTRRQALNLYATHFLSTWNMRTYEFAAIIFTAAAWPDTLLATSIRGIIRMLAAVCLSSTIGRMVDRSPDRLRTLQITITFNRITVVAACVLWYFIVETTVQAPATLLRTVVFTLILLFDILENQSATGNMLSMERDWVVAVADKDGMPYDLTHLNSSMRRIDLICKLIAPIVISLVVSVSRVRSAVFVVAGMSLISWGAEIWCARQVAQHNSKIRTPKDIDSGTEGIVPSTTIINSFISGLKSYTHNLRRYFASAVWRPSLALAFLHLSALSYGATFITYLLSIGISLEVITIARAAGSIIEVSSTVITPTGISYLGKAVISHGQYRRVDHGEEVASSALLDDCSLDEHRTETGLERLGLWGLSWQLMNLVPVVFALWSLSPSTIESPIFTRILPGKSSQPLLIIILFFFLSLSRLGLWTYDLTTQQLTQIMIDPSQRSTFTGVEYGFVSLFELAQHVITIVLHRPEQFRWIASGSFFAVVISTVVYSVWVWRVRGHLVHWERIKCCVGDCGKT